MRGYFNLDRVDINHSAGKCAVEGDAIRLGLNYVTGFGELASGRIEVAREMGAFISLADFVHRTRLPRKLIENLILVGAMDVWDIPRFHFITLEDEYGMMNIIVRPTIYTRYRRIIRSTTLLLVQGEIEREGEVVNVMCQTASSFNRE